MHIKNNFLRVVSCFFIIQFFILILLRFRGSYHSFYINAYNFFLDSSYFKNDMFLNNSILFDSTIYYKLLSLLGVKLETDLILFSIYLVLIFFNLYFFIKIIKKFYNPDNIWTILIYILPALVLGGFFAPNSESALIYSHTGTATQIAFTFILATILTTIQHNWKLAFFFAFISILLAAKHAAFPIFVSFTYFLIIQFGYKRLIKIYIFLSAVIILIGHIFFSFMPEKYIQEKIQIIDFIIMRNQHEDAFYLQSLRGKVKLFLGFVCLFVTIKFITNQNYKYYLVTVFYMSLAAIIFGAIYTSYLYKYYPEPYIVLLSTIKAMFLMQFFACIGASKFILDSSINYFSKSFFILVLFFGSFGGKTGENLALAFLIIGLILNFTLTLKIIKKISTKFIKYFNKFNIHLPRDSKILLIVLSITIPLTSYTLNNKLNSYSKYHDGRYTIVNTSNEFLNEVTKIQNCKDFNFLPVEEEYFFENINTNQFQNITNPFLIYFSKKSNYLGDPAHLYLDLEKQNIYLQRKNNIMNIFDDDTSYPTKQLSWSFIEKDRVIIIAPKSVLPSYLNKKTKLLSNNFIYIFSGGIEHRSEFIKNCSFYNS